MVNDCLVFFCYREGWGGMKASSSECHRDSIGSFIIRTSQFFCTSSSPLPSVTPKLFQATHQKNPVQTKMIGKVLRKNLAFTPKG